ncbi:ABC transporter ATP-binding protein [Halorubrum ezzemoulense]|uniref:ABC transporter ATP-binding protein n=1 Tax=Halorubrum ezzemoulense TaxID=337243 RepID=UPI00232F261A|nr:ABC transporter ATP-binding protein [Halorubrum ezzemoulense]MDB2265372.1 ABC transporter ATP-binding protein [Halorubrum ezzemoulense]
MSDPLLSLSAVTAGYGDLYVLEDVSLRVEEGNFVAIVGPNGAGKSTLLRTIVGGTTLHDGTIQYGNDDISRTPRHEIVDAGVGYVPQDDAVFPDLTVRENLRMGGYTGDGDVDARIGEIYDLFPRLEERPDQAAKTLSGGESRMLAIGRALMPGPDLLLIDEPSTGLAPQIVDRMFERIDEIHTEGTTVLLVEQDVSAVVDSSERVYTLRNGEIGFEGSVEEFQASDDAESLGW